MTSYVYTQTYGENSYNTKDYTYYGVDLRDSMWHDMYITQIKFKMYCNTNAFDGTLYLNHISNAGAVSQISSGSFEIGGSPTDVEFTGLTQALGSAGCHIMMSGFPTDADDAIELRTAYNGNQVPSSANKAPISRMITPPVDTSQTELPTIEITYTDEEPGPPPSSGGTLLPPPIAPVYI